MEWIWLWKRIHEYFPKIELFVFLIKIIIRSRSRLPVKKISSSNKMNVFQIVISLIHSVSSMLCINYKIWSEQNIRKTNHRMTNTEPIVISSQPFFLPSLFLFIFLSTCLPFWPLLKSKTWIIKEKKEESSVKCKTVSWVL